MPSHRAIQSGQTIRCPFPHKTYQSDYEYLTNLLNVDPTAQAIFINLHTGNYLRDFALNTPVAVQYSRINPANCASATVHVARALKSHFEDLRARGERQ